MALSGTREFGIQKSDVEFSIMDHQRIVADEGEEIVGGRGKGRMAGEEPADSPCTA